MALLPMIAVALAVPKVLRVTTKWIESYNKKCRRWDIESRHAETTILWATNGLLWTEQELEVVQKCDCVHHVLSAKQRADKLGER